MAGRETDGQAPTAASARGSGRLAPGLLQELCGQFLWPQEGILNVSSHLSFLSLRVWVDRAGSGSPGPKEN